MEIVNADSSALIALADALADWQHGDIKCLSGCDISSYDFLSVSRDGFVPVSV